MNYTLVFPNGSKIELSREALIHGIFNLPLMDESYRLCYLAWIVTPQYDDSMLDLEDVELFATNYYKRFYRGL